MTDVECTSVTGQSSQEKVEAVRAELKKANADATVVTMLDEVAWLFNLRGSDIDFNPGILYYDFTSRIMDVVQPLLSRTFAS